MLKSELIKRLAQEAKGISHEDVETLVKTVFQTMTDALCQHHRIEIRGFGSFSAKKRKARTAHNPKTGINLMVPEKWVPFFTAGKELKERANHA
ncbi:MAG: integration host factor subunit beta [Deltaproteobacteria bacterium]|nr:integration host factor subunit beta [Deltaproteobacteria bacterium]